MRRALSATVLSAVLAWVAGAAGCGSRTGLLAGSASDANPSQDAAPPEPDAGLDVCTSAVSGPNAMAGNCSTRDGRSRVRAPKAPHVTWTTKLPVDAAGYIGPAGSPPMPPVMCTW